MAHGVSGTSCEYSITTTTSFPRVSLTGSIDCVSRDGGSGDSDQYGDALNDGSGLTAKGALHRAQALRGLKRVDTTLKGDDDTLPTCQPRELAPWLPIYHFIDDMVAGPGGKPVQRHGLNDANAIGWSGEHYFVMTQDNFAFAHYRSKDLVHWERLPVALPKPAWDGALSLMSPDDGGPVIMYDLPPEPSHLGMARLKNTSDDQLIEWEGYVVGAPLTIDRSKFEPSIQPPNSPTCCSPPGGFVPRCSALIKALNCQGLMFPSAIWKNQGGKFQSEHTSTSPPQPDFHWQF